VSFLFTDVERSTALWDHHPDLMRVALARHDALLRSAVESHGGVVFSTAGDAFSAAFSRAGDAVAAALDAQRTVHAEPWPDEVPVRVRMGVHTGEAHEREGDYFGPAVNRAARLTGLAHGGQVVASLAVEELLRDQPPEAVAFRGLGQHALRGLSRPETVFQVCAPGLRLDFPPLEGSTTPGNLPTPATSFVGRTAELASLASRLPAQRLLTLVGPGGVGKSRLAIETAALVRARYPDGVWFGALAPVADPDAVVHGVAAVLSVSPEPGTTLLDSIVSRLARPPPSAPPSRSARRGRRCWPPAASPSRSTANRCGTSPPSTRAARARSCSVLGRARSSATSTRRRMTVR
jgi:class 3 adenylate cyclase